MIHICEVCGREFDSPSKTAKYCSQECNVQAFLNRHGCTMSEYRRKNYKKKEHQPIRCEMCGTPFVPHRGDVKYCSKSCKMRHENLLARVRRNNEMIHHTDAYGRPQQQCEACHKWFTPKSKDETICRSCQIFLKYTNEHPEVLR